MNHEPSLLLTPAIFFLALLSCAAVASGVNFGYSGPQGPKYWGQKYNTCIGKHQSPIDIQEHDVRVAHYPPLKFSGLDLPRELYLTNNGHTVELKHSSDDDKVNMTGGPLKGTYNFLQLHFHWGENDHEGSEDRINNHAFAMEMHAVFSKDTYESFKEAVSHPDGIAVLAFFFEVDPKNTANPIFDPIVKGLSNIEEVDTVYELPKVLRLNDLIAPSAAPVDRLQHYFTYNGSLTTPPCSEIVTWIDFKTPLYLSHYQIQVFRTIKSAEGARLTHNFRPIQPLRGRVIYQSSRAAGQVSSLSFVSLCLVALLHFLLIPAYNA